MAKSIKRKTVIINSISKLPQPIPPAFRATRREFKLLKDKYDLELVGVQVKGFPCIMGLHNKKGHPVAVISDDGRYLDLAEGKSPATAMMRFINRCPIKGFLEVMEDGAVKRAKFDLTAPSIVN